MERALLIWPNSVSTSHMQWASAGLPFVMRSLFCGGAHEPFVPESSKEVEVTAALSDSLDESPLRVLLDEIRIVSLKT
jgi:hypothetical protein